MAGSEWLGKTLGGRYRLDELLGQGGMSAVYKAVDPNLRRTVAVKLIHSHLSTDPEFVRRFEEEAAAVASLRHPNIIQVYDFNHDGNTYYMVLEFVPGDTLQDRMRKVNAQGQRLQYADVARYTSGVCDAVDYANRRGMIHRDIKPANVMLDANDQAILMDFGIAKIVGGQQHTATGAVVGTALYMSPEQIRGEQLDGRSDLYSIGVTLFEMVSGRPPFEADSTMTLMMMHLNSPVPDVRMLRPNVPEGLISIIEKAMAKDREQRYSSAAEMAAALRRESANLLHMGPGASEMVQVYQPTMRQPASSPKNPSVMNSVLPVSASAASAAAMPSPVSGSVVAPPLTGSGSTPPPASTTGSRQAAAAPPNRSMLAMGGCAVLAVLAMCIVLGGGLAYNQGWLGRRNAVANYVSTQTAIVETRVALDTAIAQPTATPTGLPLTPTESVPTPTAIVPTLEAAVVNPPTDTPSAQAEAPIATAPTGPYVDLVSISLDGEEYVVIYETIGFIERSGGRHIHFFFDSVTPEELASGQAQLVMWMGPRPFRGLTIYDVPEGAKQMCALVASPEHVTAPGSGNCIDLPVFEGPTPTPPPAATIKPTKEPKDPSYDY